MLSDATPGDEAAAGDDPVDVLRRWEASGAVWRVVARTSSQATVALCTCDGGEEVDRLVSTDARLLGFLDDRDGDP